MAKKSKAVTVDNATPSEVLSDVSPVPGTFVPLPPDGRYERNRRLAEAWQKIADTARERPGEWYLVGRRKSAYVTQVNKGRLAAFRPAGHFEASSRNVDYLGDADLYVRYVGEGE